MRLIKLVLPLVFCLITFPAWATTYFAVATGNWSSSAVWSLTSGGAGGAGVPGTADTAVFDAASGAITVTVDAATTITSITASGFTGTITNTTGAALTVTGNADFTGMSGTLAWTSMNWNFQGNLTLSSAMTFNPGAVNFTGSSIVTSSGHTFALFSLNSGDVTLADDLTTNTQVTVNAGTFDAATNNVNVTVAKLQAANSASAIINMGAGTWTITGNGANSWSAGSSAVVNAGTSLLKFTGAFGADRNQTFGGHTYYNVENATTGGNALVINDGGSTFHDFTADAGSQTKFLASSTQTATAWAFNGTSGSPCTLASKTGGTFFTLSQASGTATATYTTISDSHGTGGATFNATVGSTDGGGNTGWNFGSVSSAAKLLMHGFP